MRVILSLFFSAIRYSEKERKKKNKNVRRNFIALKSHAPVSINNATPAVPIHAYRYDGSINIYVVAREISISSAIRCIPRCRNLSNQRVSSARFFQNGRRRFRVSLPLLLSNCSTLHSSIFPFDRFVSKACSKKFPLDSSK